MKRAKGWSILGRTAWILLSWNTYFKRSLYEKGKPWALCRFSGKAQRCVNSSSAPHKQKTEGQARSGGTIWTSFSCGIVLSLDVANENHENYWMFFVKQHGTPVLDPRFAKIRGNSWWQMSKIKKKTRQFRKIQAITKGNKKVTCFFQSFFVAKKQKKNFTTFSTSQLHTSPSTGPREPRHHGGS